MEFYIFEKVNNSIATKLRVTLLKNSEKNICSVIHNSMTNLCSAQFKCENKLKIGWGN